MGDSSLIRATLLIALLAAVGFAAAGRAPAAESPMAFDKGLKPWRVHIAPATGVMAGRHDGKSRVIRCRSRPFHWASAWRRWTTLASLGGGAARRFPRPASSLQPHDQRQLLPHLRVAVRLRRRPSQRRLRPHEILGQRIGQPEIGEDRGLVRRDSQRGRVIALGFAVPPHLVERGALDRKDAPVGCAGGVGALEHLERPFVIAGIRKRAPIGGEHAAIARVLDRRAFEHREDLRVLAVASQRAGIIDRGVRIVRMRAVALGRAWRRTLAFGSGNAEGGRHLRRLGRLAAGERDRKRGGEHPRQQALDATEPVDRADHHGPVGRPRRVPAIKR